MMRNLKTCAGAVVLLVVLTRLVSAGTITHSLDVPPGPDPIVSGPGLGLASVPVVSTNSPNNDNQPGGPGFDNNIAVPLKRFDRNLPIDIEFIVRPSEGTTEYHFVEFVDNNTGLPWVGYRMELGFGVGAGFVPAPVVVVPESLRLDFDAPFFDLPPTSTAMVPSLLSPNVLEWSGFHAAGAHQYSFRIDVPDLPPGGPRTFTLRQLPIPVPEPSALALAGMMLLGVACSRRRI